MRERLIRTSAGGLSTVSPSAMREWPASRSRPRLALVSGSTHAPLIRKFDCRQLPVGDLEVGVAFYERLGHEVIWRRPNQVGLGLPDTDTELVLQTERPDARVDLLVEDVRAAVERFVAAGGRVVVHPFPIEIGLCAVVADPHGNELELLEHEQGTAPSSQRGDRVMNPRARRYVPRAG
jgi:lactoylglutathione lyase